MKFAQSAAAALLCVASLLLPSAAFSQATNSGDIRGVVTDPTGAVIPGVTVTVVNVNTGVTKVLETNGDGLYDTSSIVVGTYSVTFERTGFGKFSRSSITLPVGTSTVNAVLQVGGTTQEVVVNTDIPLLETESGTQQTTLEARSMQALPNVGQDWQNFAILIPGSSGYAGNNVNPQQQISANGNLPYSNVLADGASVTLGTSANADVNVFETVQEVQISTSAFSAQYGIGGIIFNQISKGGTNQFHGSAYEYFQSSQFNANSYQFSGRVQPLAFLRYNNFGGSIGGPITVPHTGLGKRAFFYFNYDQVVSHGSATRTNDVPTVDVLNGNFTAQGMYPIYDPTTQVIGHDRNGHAYPIRQSFASEYGSNSIPATLFDKVSAKFKNFFPTPDNHIAGGHFQTGTPSGFGTQRANFYAQVPQQNPEKRYFGRIDYDINAKNRLTFSLTQGDTPAFAPATLTFGPVGTASADVSRLNMQVTDVYTISSHLINEARFGFTYQGNFFADGTYGKGYPSQLGWQFAKADEIPGVQFQRNYSYAWIQPTSDQFIYKENVFDPSDVVTLIKGKHVLHFGGEVGIYRNDNTPYRAIDPGTFQFNGVYTEHWSIDPISGNARPDSNTGAEFADFLLGDAQSWTAQNAGEYGARLKNPQVFIQDDFKVLPNLTLNLGVRYQVRLGISEVKGNVGTYDPTVLNPANNTPGAFWYGTTHANGRHNLQSNKYTTVLPRVGFSYLPNPNMTIRGGFGMYAYNLSLDTYGSGGGISALGNVTTYSGNYNDPTNGITPAIKFDGPGTQNLTGAPLPFVSPGTSPTRFNGQTVQYVEHDTPDPQIYQYNFGIQQTLGTNMVFNMSYVGSHGYHLNFQTDLNQVPTSQLSSPNRARPNPNYNSILGSTNDTVSNYNSLQAEINRRMSHGLSLDFSYTWSHFLDDQDSSGFGGRSGPISRQYPDAASNYSNSNFDVRNAFKGRIVYELPIGRGRQFFNHNYLVDAILGGYQISSTMQLQSGNPFTLFAYGQNTNAEPGSNPTPFVNYSGYPLLAGGHSKQQWFNPAAFTLPDNGTFGNVRRNTVYGPGLEYVNISAGKRFSLYENLKLQIRLDATNAFNHPSFSNPNGNLTPFTGQQVGQPYTQAGASSGTQLNGVSIGGRNLQGGLRLEF